MRGVVARGGEDASTHLMLNLEMALEYSDKGVLCKYLVFGMRFDDGSHDM
jgi:hypothetical protein